MKVLLVDGSALAYRAFFAFARAPLRSSRGETTTVPFAFLTTLLRWLRHYAPERAAVVFDAPGETHRHRLDPAYKANRPARPEGLVEQLPRLHQALAAMRLPVIAVPGWEADDVLATMARDFEARGDEVLLASSDKDFRQILSSGVRLVRPKLGAGDDDEIGPEELRRSLGLGPESIVDLMALVGDPVDNVAGIEGVGEKTAAALLRDHGTLDRLFANLDAVQRPALRRKLEEGRARALAARDLVRLRVDAPIDAPGLVPEWPGPDWPALRTVLRELELVQLLRQLPAPAAVPPALPVTIVEEPAALAAVAARLAPSTTLALHVAMEADGRAPAAVGLAADDTVFVVRLAPPPAPPRPGELAFDVPAGRGIDAATMREALGPLFAAADRTVVGADLKSATRALAALGIEVASPLFDVGVASYVLQPERRRHDLESLRLEHLEERASAAPSEPTAVAAESATAVARLQTTLAPRLAAAPPLWELFQRVEMPLLGVLRDMETVGVRVDTEALGGLSREIEARAATLAATVQSIAGHPFNLHSTQQLGQVLFVELKLPHGRRTRLGWSTDADVLEALAGEHEIARALLEHRTITKLRSTYCDALPRLVDPQTGRIHTTFHQTVASTGRLSSSDPNLQNIPIRSDLGRRIRAAFVPRDAKSVLVSADYSQIELRILAHLSGDAALRAALSGDVHANTAARIAGCAPEDVTPAQRAAAKAVNFGVVYGMGARGLADRLGIPIEEARRFIDEYFTSYPEVHRLTRALVEKAHATGEATTILGRRLALPELASPNPGRRAAAERVAVNAPIQGSAADLIKVAMVRVHGAIAAAGLRGRLVLQVHDELVFDAPSAELDTLRTVVRDAMCGALQLSVPLVVEIGAGRNWAEAH